MRAYLLVALILLLIFGSISGYLYQKFSRFADMDFTPPPITIAATTAGTATTHDYNVFHGTTSVGVIALSVNIVAGN